MIIRTINDLAVFAVARRKKLGLTQSEVADKVGLKQKTVSAFENKPDTVMLSTAFLILSALDLDLDILNKSDNQVTPSGWEQSW